MLNDEYNKIVNDKTQYEIKYERIKKWLEEFENIDENENVESLDAFVKLVRNASIKVDISVITIVTSKKLFDSLILIDDKDLKIENWLFVMKNKLKENVDWFSIETSKKAYVRILIDENAMNHLTSRFKKTRLNHFLLLKEFLMISIECSMILIKKWMF
jgi:hypothetical protein